jgi:hypothetical protein
MTEELFKVTRFPPGGCGARAFRALNIVKLPLRHSPART